MTGRSGGSGSGPRYISRLECLKEAISRHMDHLSVTEGNSKVALVTFDNKVKLYEYYKFFLHFFIVYRLHIMGIVFMVLNSWIKGYLMTIVSC